jgi:septum formation protein
LELLRSLGLDVETIVSGYAEPPLPGRTPLQIAAIHAREKLAAAVASVEPARRSALLPIVAADTVVDVDGIDFGKPADPADAADMLRRLSAREHRVHTAFAMRLPGVSGTVEETATTSVRFFALSAGEIEDYVASGEPMDKAGAYGIQGRAAALVESIDGDFYTVMGFPLGRFVRTLRRLGFVLPAAKKIAP